jgi:SAM-dependent methyltransferase
MLSGSMSRRPRGTEAGRNLASMSDGGLRTQSTETWDSGETYERYVGRWSRRVARDFLAWLAIPVGRTWLDVGCGTGALTQTILAMSAPGSVRGVDPSDRYIAYARAQTTDARARFEVGDARALSVDDQSYDAVVSGLALNFVPLTDQVIAAGSMLRAARPDGVVAAYLWDYAGRMEFMRYFWDAAIALDPLASDLDEGQRFPLCHPKSLAALFRAAGVSEVETRAIDIPTTFRNFDDYWSPFLGGQGPAPAYVNSLNANQRTRLRDQIHRRLPVERNGSIHLIARAWAVRGRRPLEGA